MSKVQAELVKATGVKAKKGEDRQTFLTRLAEAATDSNTVNEDAWGALSKDATDWANTASKAVAKGKKIADFQTEEAVTESGADETAEEDGDKMSKPKKRAKKNGTKEVKAEAPAKPAKAAKSVEPKKHTGTNVAIMTLMWDDMTLQTRDILEKLAKKKINTSEGNVNVVRAQFRASVRFLAQQEALKKQPIL